MAKYWNQSNLTISGMEPDSMVGVWITTKDGDIDEKIFIGKVGEQADINVPTNTDIFVRVRHHKLRTFETSMNIENDGLLTVIKVEDDGGGKVFKYN